MAITYIQQTTGQPGEVAYPARGQLNRENKYFAVCPRSRLIIWSRETRPSRAASACSFSKLGLNLVLTHGILPDLCGGVLLSFLIDSLNSQNPARGHKVENIIRKGKTYKLLFYKYYDEYY